MSYYLIRVGEGSKYIEEARKDGFVAIGWNEVPDIKQLGNLEKIKDALRKSYQYSDAQLAAQSGQLYRFGIEIDVGDTIISPLRKGEYLVGLAGEYYFEQNPKGACEYKHRRKVEWKSTILKEDMSTNLSYSLGATLTIFSLDKYTEELELLIAGRTYTPAEKPQRIRDIILEGLMDFDGKEFEEFIQHLLEIVGFRAETTPYVGDKGIDVNGILDAEGLVDVTLRVQVKRMHGSIGHKEILALRGTLGQGEHGCFITTSTFTAQARQEGEATGKINIKLIDGEDLSALILKHFDDLDEEYKKKFNIRKKKDFNIEDQFEIQSSEPEETLLMKEQKIKKPLHWDTLVCAAKEEGFKKAFLEKKAWWAVRLNPKMVQHIKYIAIYQVAPISKITHYGKVKKIEEYESSGKYKLYLDGEPIKLENPVGLGKNRHLKPQGPRYAQMEKIKKANSLDDVFEKTN